MAGTAAHAVCNLRVRDMSTAPRAPAADALAAHLAHQRALQGTLAAPQVVHRRPTPDTSGPGTREVRGYGCKRCGRRFTAAQRRAFEQHKAARSERGCSPERPAPAAAADPRADGPVPDGDAPGSPEPKADGGGPGGSDGGGRPILGYACLTCRRVFDAVAIAAHREAGCSASDRAEGAPPPPQAGGAA